MNSEYNLEATYDNSEHFMTLFQLSDHILPYKIKMLLNSYYLIVYRKANLMHKLFLVYFVKLYMFRTYLGPSSGGKTICIQHWVLLYDCMLCWLGCSNPSNTTDKPETWRVWRNILRKSCVSSWFFFTRLHREARPKKHKKVIR